MEEQIVFDGNTYMFQFETFQLKFADILGATKSLTITLSHLIVRLFSFFLLAGLFVRATIPRCLISLSPELVPWAVAWIEVFKFNGCLLVLYKILTDKVGTVVT